MYGIYVTLLALKINLQPPQVLNGR